MRYAALAGALALALFTGICEAADENTKTSTGPAAVTQDSAPDKGLRHIDLGEEPVDRIGTMNEGQDYDENTGLPDVVQSDGDMDLN